MNRLTTRNSDARFFSCTEVLAVLRYTNMSNAPASCSLLAFLPAATSAASARSAKDLAAFTKLTSASRLHAVSCSLKSLTNACVADVTAANASSALFSAIAPKHWQWNANTSSCGWGKRC